MSEKNRGPMGGGPASGLARGGEKARNFRGAIYQLASYAKSYWFVSILAILLAAAGSVLNIIGPDYLSQITDKITEGLHGSIDISGVVSIAMLLSVFYGVGFLCNVVQGILMSDVSQNISRRLRDDISVKINRLPLRYFDTHLVGDTLSRITNDVDTVGQSLTQSLGSLVSALTLLLGALFMMLRTNVLMTLAGLVGTLIGFAFMMTIVAKSQKYFALQQSELGRLNSHIEENLSGQNIVQAYNGVDETMCVFDNMNDKLYRSAWRSQFMSGLMQPLMMFVGNLGYVMVCITGAVLAMNGTISFGTIVAFMLYIRLFTQPLTTLAQVATSMQSAAAASERVFEFLAETELPDESGKLKKLDYIIGDVSFQNVSFGYTKDKTVIHNFTAHAWAGQKIAIVGPTGAGKTTLVNLLMRFYEVDSGQISIDYIPTIQLSRENVHDLFGMVLQDTWLFEGTIRDNIVYNQPSVSDEYLDEVCRAVGLYHFIHSLPAGYDTVLDDSASLSAGQRQLITIARAMVKNAPMLILDEATSSVDTRTEILIQRAMDQLMKDRTSFIIAHRLSTIRNADLILVMKDGDVIESGTHDELIAQNGFYAELYNCQFIET